MHLPHRPSDRLPAGPARLAGLLVLLLAGCAPGEGPVGPETPDAVRELVEATTLPAPNAGPLAQGEWIERREAALERALGGPSAVGGEALRTYREGSELPVEVRQALLRVAAHHAPEETTPVLEDLVLTYGADLDLRKEACAILARAAPARACEILEPLVRNADKDGTYPSDEALLAAYVEAARAIGRPVDELLALVATDIYQESAVRHRAVRELGNERGWRAETALEQVLIESTGNAYLRRLAAQAMLRAMEPADACAIFERVYDREADDRFMVFLADVIQRNCQSVGEQ